MIYYLLINIIVFVFSIRLTGKEKRVGNFDLVWHNGPIMADNLPDTASHSSSTHPTNSFLGEAAALLPIYIFIKFLEDNLESYLP